jgi:hypothetical protein
MRYVLTVLDRYRATPGTTGRIQYSDRALAMRLYDRNVSLATIDAAFVITVARRTFRYDDAAALGPIRSLHYFVPVIFELLRQPADPEYLRHLRLRLAKHNAR